MANYPCSYIYLASLLEGSGCQGATTLWTDPGLLLCIKIYPTRIQVAWQDVTTQVYLGIFIDICIRARTRRHARPARWLGYYRFTVSYFHYSISYIGICTAYYSLFFKCLEKKCSA
jgi:hypothetical protein